MNTILVVEDEVITSELLRRYFNMVGYEVINALTGKDAIETARKEQPTVIILDIMLPDMDGYEICKQLRADPVTDRIPIIFLTQKDDRRDRLDGLGLGADDYITKPFDIEELRLRVHNTITRVGGTVLVDARTSLPNTELIKERLPRLLADEKSAFADIQILGLADFGHKYGPVAQNQVVRGAARIIGDMLHEADPQHSFIGHPREDHFLITLREEALARVLAELPSRFAAKALTFYDDTDQKAGHMSFEGKQYPLMSFKVLRVGAEALRQFAAQSER